MVETFRRAFAERPSGRMVSRLLEGGKWPSLHIGGLRKLRGKTVGNKSEVLKEQIKRSIWLLLFLGA